MAKRKVQRPLPTRSKSTIPHRTSEITFPVLAIILMVDRIFGWGNTVYLIVSASAMAVTITANLLARPRDRALVIDFIRQTRQRISSDSGWRARLESAIYLPLTREGAMTTAIDRFSKRMSAVVAELGDPSAIQERPPYDQP
jgi:hypothetical protein